jgi:hypothetical protein
MLDAISRIGVLSEVSDVAVYAAEVTSKREVSLVVSLVVG